jgi:drug/metabolite transporter superfamily protein YnfA
VALVWLRLVEGVAFSRHDLLGSAVLLSGMAIPMGGGSRSWA